MIQRLYVNNYRCLENFELTLGSRPSTLLIGGNGSGKSTVASVLEVFQSIGRGVSRVGELVREQDFANGHSDVPIRFELEVVIGGITYEYGLALELPEGFKELRILGEHLSVAGTTVYSRDRAQIQLVRSDSRPDSTFLVDWHVVALSLIQERSTVDPLYIFRNWIKRMLILAPIPSLITGASEGELMTPTRYVTDFGAWVSGVLARSPAAYTHIDRYLKEVVRDFRDVQNPATGKDHRTLTVTFQSDQANLNLPFNSLSDGEKCFFICAVVIAVQETDGPAFCFWDEPDNYLSPAEVGHFVMDLRRLFRSEGQLIVTSHNPEAIRQFTNDSTHFLQRRSHLEPTVARPLSDVEVNGDLIAALTRGDVQLWP